MALITQSENPHIVKLHEQVKEATPHLNETEQARLTAAAGVEVQKRGFNAANLGDLECYECKGRQLLNMEDLGKQALLNIQFRYSGPSAGRANTRTREPDADAQRAACTNTGAGTKPATGARYKSVIA